jgi:type IV secretion system protein VirB10
MTGQEQAGEAAPAPKQDPESLVLRGRPRPVVRFRRGLIIGSAAVLSAALVAITWAALEPPSFTAAAEQDRDAPPPRGTPEAIARVPASYGDVPQLGPPLPGDLGRPILEHRRNLEAEAQASVATGSAPADRARAAAEAERGRLAAAELAARSSGVLVQLSGAGHGAGKLPDPAPGGETGSGHVVGGAAGNEQRGPDGALRAAVHDPALAGETPLTLSAGTVIPASLITGLNSDLPGTVLAQVTEHVRDSATGRAVLIPQGARLIGSYDSKVAYGQRRALLVWQRILMPDGSSVALDNAPATDPAGYAGIEDRVDFHGWRLLKGIALSSLLGVGSELGLGSSESDLVRAVRESAQQSGARAGDQITARNLDLPPTLRVRPGWPVRAIVHKDLALRPWRG